MDLTGGDTTLTIVCGILIAAGIVGVVVPMLPGLLLSWLGVLVWAILVNGGPGKWVVLAIATVIAIVGAVVKFVVPGRKLKRHGVSNWSLLAGAVLGIVGFFAVPVVGLVLGFVLGIWLAEALRLKDARAAWPATWHAVKATGLSIFIEMFAGLCVAAVWVGGLLLV